MDKATILQMMRKITLSPFEQFEIHRIIPMKLGETLDISITNSTIYMVFAVGVYMILYKINIEGGTIVPGR
jgi:hypothetical protein